MKTLKNLRYDVVCAGGGASGVFAAVAAARTGARVLLLERTGFLGGAAALGMPLRGVAPQDVYKRQILRTPCNWKGIKIIEAEVCAAVSYTHLDVYKRQQFDFLFRFSVIRSSNSGC